MMHCPVLPTLRTKERLLDFHECLAIYFCLTFTFICYFVSSVCNFFCFLTLFFSILSVPYFRLLDIICVSFIRSLVIFILYSLSFTFSFLIVRNSFPLPVAFYISPFVFASCLFVFVSNRFSLAYCTLFHFLDNFLFIYIYPHYPLLYYTLIFVVCGCLVIAVHSSRIGTQEMHTDV